MMKVGDKVLIIENVDNQHHVGGTCKVLSTSSIGSEITDIEVLLIVRGRPIKVWYMSDLLSLISRKAKKKCHS